LFHQKNSNREITSPRLTLAKTLALNNSAGPTGSGLVLGIRRN